MIPYEETRLAVVKGLKEYLHCEVIRGNQTAQQPTYPFIVYNVTIPMSENKGTWQEHEDGYDRKSVLQTWSVTALSDNSAVSVTLACKAREWLDRVGRRYLYDKQVTIASLTSVTNRDNFLTTDYEYRNGFDVSFRMYDTVLSERAADDSEIIDAAVINDTDIQKQK